MNDIGKWVALISAITGFVSSGLTVLLVKLIEARSGAKKQDREGEALLLEARAKAEAKAAEGEAALIAARAKAEKEDAEEESIREETANKTFNTLAQQCKERVDHLEEMLRCRETEWLRLREDSNNKILSLQEQVSKLVNDVITLRAENQRLRNSVRVLTQQLSRAGIQPEVVHEEVGEMETPLLVPKKRWENL